MKIYLCSKFIIVNITTLLKQNFIKKKVLVIPHGRNVDRSDSEYL